jgi:hypothetical protein
MGFLDRLLHRTPTAQTTPAPEPAPCIHGALVPRWDNVADMGQEDKATSYRCDSCYQEFTPEEARAMRAIALERMRDLSEPPSPN